MEYRSFSNVVADNQYAALGLVLIGTLARFTSVIRPFTKEDDLDELDELADQKAEQPADDGPGEVNDFGEVVKREDIQMDLELDLEKDEKEGDDIGKLDDDLRGKASIKMRRAVEEDNRANPTEVSAYTPVKMRKKRKNGDTFDEIFDSLI